MSNPYKRKALTLASSFVVASTVLSSGAIAKPVPDGGPVIKPEIIKPEIIKPFPVVTNPVGPEIKMPQVIIRIPRPQVVNPAPINDLRVRAVR
jgi:hypothetical protein